MKFSFTGKRLKKDFSIFLAALQKELTDENQLTSPPYCSV